MKGSVFPHERPGRRYRLPCVSVFPAPSAACGAAYCGFGVDGTCPACAFRTASSQTEGFGGRLQPYTFVRRPQNFVTHAEFPYVRNEISVTSAKLEIKGQNESIKNFPLRPLHQIIVGRHSKETGQKIKKNGDRVCAAFYHLVHRAPPLPAIRLSSRATKHKRPRVHRIGRGQCANRMAYWNKLEEFLEKRK
jgi:hypothetical protein